MSIEIKEFGLGELEEMCRQDNQDRQQYALDAHNLQPLLTYMQERIAPGGFLTAVLENNLKEAMGRADMYNRRKVFEYVQWLYNNAPSMCWGSPEKVEAWLYPKENKQLSEGSDG